MPEKQAEEPTAKAVSLEAEKNPLCSTVGSVEALEQVLDGASVGVLDAEKQEEQKLLLLKLPAAIIDENVQESGENTPESIEVVTVGDVKGDCDTSSVTKVSSKNFIVA